MHLSTLVEIAADLRRRADLLDPPFSTVRLIAACFPGTAVGGGTLPPGVDELVSRRDGGPVIVYSRALSSPEQRFAIAHGIAHVVFGDLDDALAHSRPGCLGNPANEERADAFAAELLVPLALLASKVQRFPSRDPEEHERYLDHVDSLASRFAVPSFVIDSQIRMVGR